MHFLIERIVAVFVIAFAVHVVARHCAGVEVASALSNGILGGGWTYAVVAFVVGRLREARS